MSNRVQLSITIPLSQRKTVEEILKSVPSLVIEDLLESDSVVKGTGSKESINKLFGSWDQSKPRMSATQVRKNAWQRKVRKS